MDKCDKRVFLCQGAVYSKTIGGLCLTLDEVLVLLEVTVNGFSVSIIV